SCSQLSCFAAAARKAETNNDAGRDGALGRMILSFRKALADFWAIVMMMVLAATLTSGQSQTTPQTPASARYVDEANGMTADEAVAYALAHNGELQAARKEIDAAKAMVKQARLRANPKLDIEGTRQIPPGKDNSVMATAMLPLELGGRRSTRIDRKSVV